MTMKVILGIINQIIETYFKLFRPLELDSQVNHFKPKTAYKNTINRNSIDTVWNKKKFSIIFIHFDQKVSSLKIILRHVSSGAFW